MRFTYRYAAGLVKAVAELLRRTESLCDVVEREREGRVRWRLLRRDGCKRQVYPRRGEVGRVSRKSEMVGCQRWLDAGAWAGAWWATVGLLEGGGERCRRLARREKRYPQQQAPGAFFSSWFAVNGELVIKHCLSRAMVLGRR
jgi:hypothetical protein